MTDDPDVSESARLHFSAATALGALDFFLVEFENMASSHISNRKKDTPQRYNKKPVEFDQALDFLKVWRGKSKKQ